MKHTKILGLFVLSFECILQAKRGQLKAEAKESSPPLLQDSIPDPLNSKSLLFISE